MSARKAKRHTHKYHKVTVAGQKVWACALGDCNHYMGSHLLELMPGKDSICWSCGEKMKLDEDNMQNDRPICIECANPELLTVASKIGEI